jgi:hypothetical protein
MKLIEPDDILDLTAYEKIRETYLEETIALKRPRRIHVGDRLCFIFENRRTVTFQIQEMTRAERSVEPEAIAEEIRVYNELIPAEHELSATLMIEIPDAADIKAELDHLVGIDEHVYMEVGSETVRARFDEKQFEEDRISAVQYLKFSLGEALATAFRDPTVSVALRVDHPSYSARTAIEGDSRASLAADLAAEA